jgi:hypothetical protein
MRICLSVFFGFVFTCGFSQFENIPIILSLPFDSDTIETNTPTFVWQCNQSAIKNDSRYNLQFSLVKLENNQTSSEAIQINPTIYFVDGLLSTTLTYPGTGTELMPGETYVWQLKLLFNQQVVQISEAWKFTLANPKKPKDQYILLRRKPDGSKYIIQEPILHIMLKNEGKEIDSSLRIIDGQNNSHSAFLTPVQIDSLTPSNQLSNFYYMVNFEDLDLPNGVYYLEWKDANKEVYHLKFKLE